MAIHSASLFPQSRLKVEWANKHVRNLNSTIAEFLSSDFYSVTVEKRFWNEGTLWENYRVLTIDASRFPLNDCALIIGDALHNFRSSLDFLQHRVVQLCGGSTTKWTSFPIRETREKLIGTLRDALEEGRISLVVHDFILDTIKPYQTGNGPLWSLHPLNIADKHELLTPLFKIMRFGPICLQDDQQLPFDEPTNIFSELSTSDYLGSAADNRNITVKDQGRAAGVILFHLGTPYEGSPVIPALTIISEEVTRTIDAFDLLLGSS
jgi:hypothetical protein